MKSIVNHRFCWRIIGSTLSTMILIDCHHCGHPHLATNGDVRSLTTVDDTVLGEILCAVSGNAVIHDFTNGRTINPAVQLASNMLPKADAS